MGADDGFSDFFYPSQDGLRLHARVYSAQNAATLPVVCLPGLSRNARDFHQLALHLTNRSKNPRKIICFDYRGRGSSDYDPNWHNYNVGVEANDVIAGLEALGISEAAFVGTSRGGLIIHVLAAIRPALIKAVVLNDIGPVIEVAGLAQIQSYLGNARRPKSVAEAEAMQRSIHGEAFPALQPADWTRFVHAIYRNENGIPVADYDPALVDTVLALDLTQPLPTLWPQFDLLANTPMLAIRGANSRLLSEETLVEMACRHSQLDAITVAGQGHAPFLETDDLPEAIARFVDRVDANMH